MHLDVQRVGVRSEDAGPQAVSGGEPPPAHRDSPVTGLDPLDGAAAEAVEERILHLDVAGVARACRLRVPRRRAPDPALLVNLAGTAEEALAGHPYRLAPRDFLAAGHAVVAFDLPNHGALADRFGSGLTGMAAAVAGGVDVFAALRAHGRAAVDACVARGLGRAGRVFVAGTSRGGLAALHLLAADGRIAAAAVNAPVTHLPALREFALLGGAPLAERNSALTLTDRIGRRPVWIGINRADSRVGTAHCRRFFARLRASQGASSASSLHVYEGETHRLPDAGFALGARWLLGRAG